MRIEQLSNDRGNKVANHFIIRDNTPDGVTILQSYSSIVCIINHTKNILFFGDDWDYSRTTMKYVNQFIRDNTSINQDNINANGIRKMIKHGVVENGYYGHYTIKTVGGGY